MCQAYATGIPMIDVNNTLVEHQNNEPRLLILTSSSRQLYESRIKQNLPDDITSYGQGKDKNVSCSGINDGITSIYNGICDEAM